MPQTRDIKRRIKSVHSTKKVTKAMEMVSAAKMRKAVSNVLASRSYASLAWELVKNLALRTDSKYHPLLKLKDKIKTVAVVLITSNRGLCGGFNAQIINRTTNYIKQQYAGSQTVLVTLGKKGRDFSAKRGFKVVADFEKLDITTRIDAIRPLAKLLIADYLAGKADKVVLAYTDFISTLVQKPRVLELLPIAAKPDADLGNVERTADKSLSSNFEYLFEPSPDKVLSELLPRLLETQIYQAILESDAAEHSARMVAMRNASEAAGDMINSLTFAYNKDTQALITAELADICGGRAAIE